MSPVLETFRRRLHNEWLPAFCGAPHRNYSSTGFKEASAAKLTEHDAHWFMRAVDVGLVVQADGFFIAPQSRAKEQIFWDGRKEEDPRSITLWLEPIITIGAVAFLNQQYGWPARCLGAQSKTWAFDLVGYGSTPNEEILACEVKKTWREVETLLLFMGKHAAQQPSEDGPTKERNAYRKVRGIRVSWPKIFWALGPGGAGRVFRIRRDADSQLFQLEPTGEEALRHGAA